MSSKWTPARMAFVLQGADSLPKSTVVSLGVEAIWPGQWIRGRPLTFTSYGLFAGDWCGEGTYLESLD